ncbi:hypothetical protein [Burkholderia phage BCSR5]|nr:hypothetical protein [Burkholderia phage BCSR5]
MKDYEFYERKYRRLCEQQNHIQYESTEPLEPSTEPPLKVKRLKDLFIATADVGNKIPWDDLRMLRPKNRKEVARRMHLRGYVPVIDDATGRKTWVKRSKDQE